MSFVALKNCKNNEYQRELNILKDKYAHEENKKKLSGVISVYLRPTYTAHIPQIYEDSYKIIKLIFLFIIMLILYN